MAHEGCLRSVRNGYPCHPKVDIVDHNWTTCINILISMTVATPIAWLSKEARCGLGNHFLAYSAVGDYRALTPIRKHSNDRHCSSLLVLPCCCIRSTSFLQQNTNSKLLVLQSSIPQFFSNFDRCGFSSSFDSSIPAQLRLCLISHILSLF